MARKRITKSDVDALIEVVGVLRLMAESVTEADNQKLLHELEHRTRKVYMMLLHAGENHQMTISDLFQRGFSEGTPISDAINTLCPLAVN